MNQRFGLQGSDTATESRVGYFSYITTLAYLYLPRLPKMPPFWHLAVHQTRARTLRAPSLTSHGVSSFLHGALCIPYFEG